MIRIEGIPIAKARLCPTLRTLKPDQAGADREALPRRVQASDPGVEADRTVATTMDLVAV